MIKKIVHFIISRNVRRFVKKGGKLGSDYDIHRNVKFGSEPYLIRMGNHVRITAGVKFITHDGGMWVLRKLGENNIDKFGRITIGDNVFIGFDSIVLPGTTIGNNVVVGAGCVVRGNVPDNVVIAGVPCKIIETIDEYRFKAMKNCDYTKAFSAKEKRVYLSKKFNL